MIWICFDLKMPPLIPHVQRISHREGKIHSMKCSMISIGLQSIIFIYLFVKRDGWCNMFCSCLVCLAVSVSDSLIILIIRFHRILQTLLEKEGNLSRQVGEGLLSCYSLISPSFALTLISPQPFVLSSFCLWEWVEYVVATLSVRYMMTLGQ